MLGLIPYNSGKTFIDDLLITQADQQKVANLVGYVPQEGGLFPHLSASRNVSLVAEVRNWPRERIESRLLELSSLVGLEMPLLDRYPKELSGGQRQRVSLMRALMTDPDILMFDEPLGALDPIIRRDLQEQLSKIFELLKKTVILVTHDIGEAAYFGDTITMLDEGVILQNGSFTELIKNPASEFVTEFINSPAPDSFA